MSDQKNNSGAIDGLLEIMAKLRDPDGGCPWDVEQTFATIVPHTIEEAYEVADAIENKDMDSLKDELGDLLFQVVFYAQMAKEEGAFDFHDIVAGISKKMVRRHPHVFADAVYDNPDERLNAWEETKRQERAEKENGNGGSGGNVDNMESALDGVIHALPALSRAHKLQKRAARVGFDWKTVVPVVGKVREELEEVEAEIRSGDFERLEDEVGDLLFCCVNLARKLEIDPETALRGGNLKFERRFRRMESLMAADNNGFDAMAVEDVLDIYWTQAKREE
ncbi:MAG: nucleoside triphosphate pyrophosphohydrolase [Alphaproteobacteria bacterium]|nr:nucleoside triphosphate pyrophosphohydrolase [Alphaproteobacteria bacterium]